MKRAMKLLAMGIGVSLVTAAFAQVAIAQEGGDEGVVYRKKTIINFGEDTIDGDLTKPDAAYIESRKRVRHSNLIRIRENFRMEILHSVAGM